MNLPIPEILGNKHLRAHPSRPLTGIPPSPEKNTHFAKFFQILSKNIVKNDFLPVTYIEGRIHHGTMSPWEIPYSERNVQKKTFRRNYMIDFKEKPAPVPYDQGYRSLLFQPAIMLQFLQRFVGGAWTKKLRREDITIENGTFFIDHAKTRMADIVCKIRTRDHTGDVAIYVLLEHQSGVDKDMPFRMLEYTHLLCRNIRSSGTIPDDCELVFLPIVFYNGEQRWKVPGNVRDRNTREFPQYLAPFPYDLIRVTDYSAEQLQQRGRMFAAVMYLDLYSKNLLNKDWDIRIVEKAIAEMLNEESLELIKEFVGVVDSMFGIVIDLDTLMNQLERTKEPRGKEVAKMFRMNAETFKARIAEMGRQEGLQTGRQEGLQTGRQEGLQAGRAEGHIEERRKNARSMFSKGFSAHDIQDVTGLSDEEMHTLRNGSH